MTGIIDTTSGPTWSQSNLSAASSEEVDSRFPTGRAWRRGSGSRLSTDSRVVNGYRPDSDCYDINSVTMAGNGTVNMEDSDHIVSVHNNPFFKTYGIRTHRPESRVDDTNVQDGPLTLRSANIKENDAVFDEDEPGEYRPGSGFVFKLLGKFSSLSSAREENNYRPKRTSSLENLLDEHRRDSSIKEDVPRHMLSSLSKSVETVNHVGKPLQPLKIPTNTNRPSSDSSDKKSRLKSPREGTEGPFLGRDHIIIIEKEQGKTETKRAVSPETAGKSSGPQVISLKDEVSNVDELPKPNTVLSVRSMFEKSKSSAPLPIYSTATGPVVLSPTSNLKAPPFSAPKVSKVTPSVSSEITPNNVSKPQLEAAEPSKKRMAPKPPVQTGLPSPKPRSKQSPVIAVAPFVNEASSNKEDDESSVHGKKVNNTEGELWPEDSISKVFDSKAVIKAPVAPTRPPRKHSESTETEPTSRTTISAKVEPTTKKREKPPKPAKKVELNGFGSNYDSTPNYSENSDFNCQPESPKIETVIRYENSSKFEQIFATEIPQSDLDTHLDLHSESDTPVEVLPEGAGPVRARVITDRLKRDGNKAGHLQSSFLNNTSSQEENSVQVNSQVEFPIARKRKNNTPIEERLEPRDTTNKDILNHMTRLRPVDKGTKVSQVFDTRTQIVRTPVNHKIPPLDLSSINDDQHNGYYQEGYKPTEIKPCTFVVIGANVKLKHSSLDKTRTTKGKIKFDDNLTKTHEYPSEEVSLQIYLATHPDEPEEIQEMLILEGVSTESSDDYEEAMTPRESSDDDQFKIKSNTPLQHSDAWSTYRSKYQTEDYTFGAVMDEPEPPKPAKTYEEEVSSQIVPAEEETTWSTETTSDLLF